MNDIDIDINDSFSISDKSKPYQPVIQYGDSYIDSSWIYPYPVKPDNEPDADSIVLIEVFLLCDIIGC